LPSSTARLLPREVGNGLVSMLELRNGPENGEHQICHWRFIAHTACGNYARPVALSRSLLRSFARPPTGPRVRHPHKRRRSVLNEVMPFGVADELRQEGLHVHQPHDEHHDYARQ
jgi:hypothetical protein